MEAFIFYAFIASFAAFGLIAATFSVIGFVRPDPSDFRDWEALAKTITETVPEGHTVQKTPEEKIYEAASLDASIEDASTEDVSTEDVSA